LGASYVLSASLVDPREGQAVATRSEEASDEQQVAPAVRRLSNWVRGKLGEALPRIQHSDQELEKVTTPSLKALHLYTQAEAAIRQRGAKSDVLAEQLYRQAIVEDPDFASAYIMLAWAVRNQGKPEAEWKPPSQRALELSEKVSERERYFIQGSYYSMRDEDGKAAAIYEALLQRYPDHYWGRNNLARACNYKLRRFQDALTHYMYRADLRPNDFFMQIDAAETASRLRRMDEAFRYAKRANDLITSELPKNSNYALAWLQFFLTVESYLRGDLEASLGEVDRLAQTVDTYTGRQRDGYANFASLAYLRFGKLRTATEFAQRMSLDDNSSFNLGLIAFTRGDNESLRKSLKEHLNRSRVKDRSDVLPFLIRSGLLAEAQKFISKPSLKGEDFVKVCQGEIALVEGHPERAIPLLRDGITSLRASGNFIFLCAGADSLATAYERQNNTPESIRVLEDSTRDTGLGGSDRVLWLRNKARLAQLYRKVGRVEDALRVEADLLSVLRFADSNHPILIQIHRARSKEPSGPKKAIIRGAHPL
jgi:tetratricopeptide (TPR) repeat protein